MDITAADARRLLNDSTFQKIIARIKADQVSTFINSPRSATDAREEAHVMLEAVNKIEQALQSVITDEAMKEKRKTK